MNAADNRLYREAVDVQDQMRSAYWMADYRPAPLHFTDRSIIYYGPHQCPNCGVMITKMGFEFGGNTFTYPNGPIYPNTPWYPHVCDPERVARQPKAESMYSPTDAGFEGS